MVRNLLLKPPEHDSTVQIATAFVSKREVSIKTFVGYRYSNYVAVASGPSRSMGLEPWVFRL